MIWERKCTCCNGTGRRRVTGVYADTLDRLRRIFRWQDEIHAADLARRMSGIITPNAVNMRLARLEQFGFLKSRNEGALRLYSFK